MKALTIAGVFLAQSIDELRVFLPATLPWVDIDGVCLQKLLPYISAGLVAVFENVVTFCAWEAREELPILYLSTLLITCLFVLRRAL